MTRNKHLTLNMSSQNLLLMTIMKLAQVIIILYYYALCSVQRCHHVFPRLIAEELVRMHQVHLPSMQKETTERPVSQYQAKMKGWLDSAPTHFDNPAKQKV